VKKIVRADGQVEQVASPIAPMPAAPRPGGFSIPSAGPRPMAPRPAAPGASPLAGIAQRGVMKSTSFAAYEEAKQILSLAEEEAARIKAEAERLRDEQARAGYEEGYRKGYEEALKGLAGLEQEFDALCERLEPEVVKLAVKIAEKVIGAELSSRPEAIAAIVSQALRTVRHQREINIRVHPSHVAALEAQKQTLLGVLTRARDVVVRGDESVRPGGCVIESELGTLDADLNTQIEMLQRALGMAR
jgi:type III secretion protein L